MYTANRFFFKTLVSAVIILLLITVTTLLSYFINILDANARGVEKVKVTKVVVICDGEMIEPDSFQSGTSYQSLQVTVNGVRRLCKTYSVNGRTDLTIRPRG